MIITDLTTFLAPPRWLFLRIRTDDGVVGWGEPVVETRAHTAAAAVDEMADYLVGKDPLRIEDHWQVLTKGGFYRGGPVLSSAVAGIDQALWDIAGKVHGCPIYELLGGHVRDRARVYSEVDRDGLDELAEAAQAAVEGGFSAVKLNCSPGGVATIETKENLQAMVARAQRVREVIGPGRDLAVDCHGRMSSHTARQFLELLEPVAPLFVEEPVLPEHASRLASLATSTSIPLATGERLYSRWDFKPVFEAGVAVAQPDLSHAGGISEVRRIASMAEVYDVSVAPHCPLGPIALAASLQIAFAAPNFLIQEHSIGMRTQEQAIGVQHDAEEVSLLDYLLDRSVFAVEDGYFARPRGPGLGIEIDEAAVVRAAARGHRWRAPILRHADGSFAEW